MMKTALCVVLLTVCASNVSAQSLKLPTIVFASAATADWVTTYRTPIRFREENPVLRGLNNRPATMVLTGAAIDVALVAGWNHFVGRKHPKIAAAGLYLISGARIVFAVSNHRITVRARRTPCDTAIYNCR